MLYTLSLSLSPSAGAKRSFGEFLKALAENFPEVGLLGELPHMRQAVVEIPESVDIKKLEGCLNVLVLPVDDEFFRPKLCKTPA